MVSDRHLDGDSLAPNTFPLSFCLATISNIHHSRNMEEKEESTNLKWILYEDDLQIWIRLRASNAPKAFRLRGCII